MRALAEGGVVVGIDPGSNTGMVGLVVDEALNITHLLGSVSLAPTDSKKLTHPERDLHLADRICKQLIEWRPRHVALEEPADARIVWRGRMHQRRDTAFRLGVYYGMALAAIPMAIAAGVPPVFVQSYPVGLYRGQQGWMQGKSREFLLTVSDQMLRRIPVGPTAAARTEHELMAFGVVLHHLEQTRAARMELKVREIVHRPLRKPRVKPA